MSTKVLKLLFAITAVGLLHQSCRPASYEILKPKKGNQVDQTGAPNTLVPPQSPITGNAPAANVPPTAGIEVIWDGQAVTKVRVGRPVTIRPTASTVDPDDIGKTQCANAGIVKAAYTVGTEATPSAARTLGCESLGVPYTFTKPGTLTLDLLVTSNDDETAFASMTLVVLDQNAPVTDDGGFTIQAIPMIAQIGQSVAFDGYCQTSKAHTIGWIFGDSSTGEGVETSHAYAAAGQYRVDATCSETASGGRSWKAAVTIIVMSDTPPVNPGQPTEPRRPDGETDGPGDGTDDSADGTTDGTADGSTDGADDSNPGQNPGQEPGQN